MTIDTNDLLNSILSSISRIDYIKPEDIPNIDLYMDQVTTLAPAHFCKPIPVLHQSRSVPDQKMV